MIVKVQLSLVTTGFMPHVLIYDQDKKYIYEGPDEDGEIAKLLGGRAKAYFDAEVIDEKFSINEETAQQEW